jgi:subtilase family serine protease
MDYNKRKFLVIFSLFLFVFVLCGSVSATNNNGTVNSKGPLVQGKDLVVTSVVAPYDGAKGKTIIVPNTVKNQGTKATAGFWVNFYLRKNGTSQPIYLGHRYVPSLGSGISNHHHTTLAIPKSVADGKYFILGLVDATKKIAESNEKNNIRYSPTKIVIHNILLPDLTITNIAKTGNYDYFASVKNQGKATSPQTKVTWRVGEFTDGEDGPYDVQTKWFDVYSIVPALAPGATYTVHIQAELFSYAYVDKGGFIFESNENNN